MGIALYIFAVNGTMHDSWRRRSLKCPTCCLLPRPFLLTGNEESFAFQLVMRDLPNQKTTHSKGLMGLAESPRQGERVVGRINEDRKRGRGPLERE
jgi:hypothetical protein